MFAMLAMLGSFAAVAPRCPVTGRQGTSCLGAASGSGPDPGQKTVKGCTCKSTCGASVDDLSRCNWCYTEDSCGSFGFGGHYDYCVYPKNATYEAHGWQEKLEGLWNKVAANPQRGDYPSVAGIITEDVQVSFYDEGDEMPAGRKKYIHSVGAVCKVRWEIPSASNYTGLFAPGVVEGLVRMGSAVSIATGAGLTPGLGFKFPRTDQLSGDFVALHSLDFGQSWNFFKYNLSNHIPGKPEGTSQQVLIKKFSQATQCPPQVGLSDMARYAQSGTEAAVPRFPFKLFIVPTDEVQLPDKEKTIDELNAEMSAFPVGTPLFTMYACAEPGAGEATPTDGGVERACAKPLNLGELRTTSECVSSSFGDNKLLIRHQPVEEDWQLRRDWLTAYDTKEACGGVQPTLSGLPAKCGFHSDSSGLVEAA